jgi:hypothetical protein
MQIITKSKVTPKVTICEAVDCEKEAAEEIAVKIGERGIVRLSVCKGCLEKFVD